MKDSQRKAMFARLASNRAVAQAFAQGSMKGGAKHLFIEGDKIYSYGYHFPIAMRTDGRRAYITTKRYSHSTTRHINLVKDALKEENYEVEPKDEI